MADAADALLEELDSAPCWPLPREREAREQAAEGRALRKNDRAWLRHMHGWDMERDYICDPLARRIAFGFADFLFSEQPEITAPDDNEQLLGELDHLAEINKLTARLHRAERIVVSEGEAWWKLHVNQATADVPLLTWNSRLDVVPMFDGDQPTAVAFFTERLVRPEPYVDGDEDDLTDVHYRHAEIHTAGRVVNVLYRGTKDQLGRRVPLEHLASTVAYNPEWVHGLPILAGRVVNDLDDDDTLGVSEYGPVRDLLLALNEAVTIGIENARLTGQDRIFVAGRFRQMDGSFDASMQVFEVEQDTSTLGEGSGQPPIYGVEKSYDAEPLWLHITNLVKATVRSVGLVPQWVGEDIDGQAESGTAIRLRFLPTINAANGKLREWGDELPKILQRMLMVVALPVANGGFGRGSTEVGVPAVEFTDPLPTDTSQTLVDVAAAVAAEIMSRRTAIRELHPEWDDDQIDAELAEIAGELAPAPPPPPPPA